MPDFGAELKRRRLSAGMSLTGLAASVHFTKGYLNKVENCSPWSRNRHFPNAAVPVTSSGCRTAAGTSSAAKPSSKRFPHGCSARAQPGSAWCTGWREHSRRPRQATRWETGQKQDINWPRRPSR